MDTVPVAASEISIPPSSKTDISAPPPSNEQVGMIRDIANGAVEPIPCLKRALCKMAQAGAYRIEAEQTQ